MAFNHGSQGAPALRVGQAAEMLQVSVETLRRWETDGRLRMARSRGGQRLVPISEVTRLLAEKRAQGIDRPIVSARRGTASRASSPGSRGPASPRWSR